MDLHSRSVAKAALAAAGLIVAACAMAAQPSRTMRIAKAGAPGEGGLVQRVDGGGAAAPFRHDLGVAVFAGHYVLSGRRFDDLDALEHAVRALGSRAVRLDACGDGTARAQRSVAHRLRDLSIELRMAEDAEPACRAPNVARMAPAGLREGRRPFGIDDEAVDRWWHDRMP